MKPLRQSAIAIAAILIAFGPGFAGAQEKAPPKDPRALELLRKSAAYLAGLKSLSVRVTLGEEVVFKDKAKLKFFRVSDVALQRPNKFAVHTKRSDGDFKAIYDGSTLMIASVQEKHYVAIKAPPTYDETIGIMRDRLGFRLAVADIFSPKFQALVQQAVSHAEYIGVEMIGETEAHHLAFFSANTHWQLWLTTGDKPLPVILITTDVTQSLRPSSTAWFRNWKVAPAFDAATFSSKPPDGYARVELLPTQKPKK